MKYDDVLELDFNSTLPIGEARELLVFKVFRYMVDKIYKCKDYRFDLLFEKNNVFLKVEVKFDNCLHETGNFAIECQSRGKPSGILTTQADIWIVVDHYNRFHIIRTDKLRELCYLLTPVSTGCKDSGNKVVLVHYHNFEKHEINILNMFKEVIEE